MEQGKRNSNQRDLGEGVGIPRVGLEIGFADEIAIFCAETSEGGDVEPVMQRGKGGEISHAEVKKPDGGVEAAAVFVVLRVLVLLAEVDKGPGDLDEALVEAVVGVAGLQPEILEHVVRFVVVATVKTDKVAEVTGIE